MEEVQVHVILLLFLGRELELAGPPQKYTVVVQ